MDNFCPSLDSHDYPGQVVCYCLGITESAVIEAVCNREIETLCDLRRHTGAGDGCTSCHARLRSLLERYASGSSSALPICSVK
jgi:bacterioferritin-associated ferredoxin